MMATAKGERFWTWLAANAPRIETALRATGAADAAADDDRAGVSADMEGLIGELHMQLQSCDERAYPLLGLVEDGAIELVITADGDVAAFDDIKQLVAASPELPGWRMVALKPRIPVEQFREMGMHIDGTDVTTDDFSYALQMIQGKASLFLAFDEALDLEEDVLFTVVAAFLDQLLGEEIAATRIESVDCGYRSDVPASAALKPLWELQAELDRHWRH